MLCNSAFYYKIWLMLFIVLLTKAFPFKLSLFIATRFKVSLKREEVQLCHFAIAPPQNTAHIPCINNCSLQQ